MTADRVPDDPGLVADTVAALLEQARDIASGRHTLADSEREFYADTEAFFADVRGPGHFLWPLHLRIAQRVIGRGGFTSDELRTFRAMQADREAIERGEWSNIGTQSPD